MTQAEGVHADGLRRECYRLLSACFYPPDRDRWLHEGTCLELSEALEALYPGLEAAGHAANLHTQLAKVTDLDLRVDHAALFVGPFALKAPPYGSVYLESDQLLMGDTTQAAAACYAAAGLELTLHEPADHIAVELEFMHYLAALRAQMAGGTGGDEAARLAETQQRFLTEHLGAWTPAFCAAVTRGAETPFYRTLAECLAAFVEAEIRQSTVPAPAV